MECAGGAPVINSMDWMASIGICVEKLLLCWSLTGWSSADACGHPLEEVFKIINEDTRQPAQTPVVEREQVLVAEHDLSGPLSDLVPPTVRIIGPRWRTLARSGLLSPAMVPSGSVEPASRWATSAAGLGWSKTSVAGSRSPVAV
jgi:hypothetical protein